MKKLSLLLATLLTVTMVGASACGGGSGDGASSSASSSNAPQAVELLFDRKFEKGISVSSLQSAEQAYSTWNYTGESYTDPFWKLGQYGDLSTTRQNYDATKNSLSLGGLFTEGYGITDTTAEGVHTLTNQSGSKFISVDTATGTVNLTVDSSKEYINQETNQPQKRVNGEDWIHMILEQQCGTVNINSVDSFVMELDFTLTCNDVYDTSIGASQFQWIFCVKDSASKIGDYFWFNITLFDNRYVTRPFPGTQMFDGGKADSTGKFIYAPTGQDLFGESVQGVEVGVKYHVVLDLKAHMLNAFNIAKSKGALEQSELKNMQINGFNLGWEVSNLAKVGVEISGLSLKKVDKAS